jgi:2-keto-4-pentenoate hydratase/2-oxohepta-3-ene-1,7-dioic acid hydratase in catechol pathway
VAPFDLPVADARESTAAVSGFDSSVAGGTVHAHPIIFTRMPKCVIAHDVSVEIGAKVSHAVDYRAGLAVIIGIGGRGIAHAEAMTRVWGYMIINDVTA